jgi:quinoprotein glucose dehydrogenase
MRVTILGLVLWLASSQGGAFSQTVDWPYYGADQGGTRHSAAHQVTPDNVQDLQVAWTYRTGDVDMTGERRTSFENTPLMVNERLYLCSPHNKVIALDPVSGKELWSFDPHEDKTVQYGNFAVCRGVTYWVDETAQPASLCHARIITATNESRLYALDADSGEPCPGFGTKGAVSMGPTGPLTFEGEFQVTSAPVVVGDVIITGSAISDNVTAAAPPGTVRAYDVRSGALVWAFDPLVRSSDEDIVAGHANVWSSLSVDPKRGLVFLPVGSASPDFYGGERPGDNRHANSVVALRAQTGELVWAYQTVHHDLWDFDLPAQPTLAKIRQNGQDRDVVVAPTKTGFLFVLDRDTGKPVFEIEERPVATDGVPGEMLSPTQPVPTLPKPLVPQELAPEDAWGLTFFDRAACRQKIANARSDGLFTPPGTDPFIIFPGTGGGANWGGGAYDEQTGLFIINTSRVAHIVSLIPRDKYTAKTSVVHGPGYAPQAGTPYGMRRELLLSPFGIPCNPPPWGMVHAVDMASGELKWETPIGTTEDIAPLGIALKLGTPNFGGPIVTAGGLVFIGAAMDNYLRAFSLSSGEELWKGRLPAGGQATPMTYVIAGRQYVVIASGGHGMSGTTQGDYVIAYALPVVTPDAAVAR